MRKLRFTIPVKTGYYGHRTHMADRHGAGLMLREHESTYRMFKKRR